MLDDVRDIVGDLWPCVGFTLSYENTTTRVGKCQLPASFHFILPPAISSAIPGDNPFAGARRPADRPDVLLRSVKSEKITALKNDRVAFCTLRVESYPQLEELLLEIGYLPKPCGQQLPDWLAELTAFDDAVRREQIARSRETIARLEAGIDEARQALERNNRYKSVLVESGDALVSVVFEMLERILDVDLSHFKDDFREDFRVGAGDVTLIGEIKGVSTNVRSEHVSQLEVHVQSYLDELRDEGREETVRALLIIAHERSKPLADRQPVSEAQVALARRNGSLIVETRTLLRLFERVTDGTLSHEQARRILTENTGLLSLES